MNILVFLIGTLLTTAVGWLLLAVIEGRSPVLTRAERAAWSVVLGPTVSMYVVFLTILQGTIPLNLVGFLAPIGILLVVLALAAWKMGSFAAAPVDAKTVRIQAHALPSVWVKRGVLLLLAWSALKLFAGAYDLVSVPTYWDDSFNNWNMRGKMFFTSQKLLLEIPVGNGIVQSAQGVSSYPPTVPLFKTWMAVLRGSWQEPLINGVHLVWFAGLLGAFYLTLRRRVTRMNARVGLYALVSLPLLLIHGSNPYADIFVAAHVLIVISAILGLEKSTDAKESAVWLRLFALGIGLLVFTKNEGLILHAPLLGLLMLATIFLKRKAGQIDSDTFRKWLGLAILIPFAIALPWLAFKWLNGLTFGNAKGVSGISLTWNGQAMSAIWYHLSREPNWLLLPLVLPSLVLLRGIRNLKTDERLLGAFVLASMAIQFFLFTFVPALGTEAIMQTGLSRGLLQIAPVAMLLAVLCTVRLLNERD